MGSNEGIIQLQFNGRLGYICGYSWRDDEAEVACKQVGLGDSFVEARDSFDNNPEGK